MNDILNGAFHFESLVWHGPIAAYLFLLGLSAGATLIGLLLKRRVIQGPAWKNGFIKAVAVIAPIGIVVSLLILILHLTKPLAFWKLMIYYNVTSVMSVGVMMFQLYTAVLFVWLALVFADPINQFLDLGLQGRLRWLARPIDRCVSFLSRFELSIEWVLALLAAALGAYTGFLLSVLKTYPLLNNPWLPLLFFFSGLSSGVAGTLLLGVIGFKESGDSPSAHWAHAFEKPIIFGELVVLGIFFGWLFLSGGRAEVAALAAITSGFWAVVFWVGVVFVGLLLPLALQTILPAKWQHSVTFIVVLTSSSLLGVVSLRYFILYAGQMTVY